MKNTYKLLAFICLLLTASAIDYTGYKVISIKPKTEEELKFVHGLQNFFSVDLWNDLKYFNGVSVLLQVTPTDIEAVEDALEDKGIEFTVAIEDLQRAIENERVANSPSDEANKDDFDFSIYNRHEKVLQLLENLAEKYPKIAQIEAVGKSFENRPIYAMKIGKGPDKPAVMMDFGIHSREWASIASGAYLVNKLITTYESDPEVKKLVDKFEFNIIVMANPDGYVYTWEKDRMWRKTRSKRPEDLLGMCRGVDPNRNFDVDHCGVGTSNNPCENTYCGPAPFSEGEARAIRDLLISLGKRTKAFISIHTYSQLWMTPYGITKDLPSNYDELTRVGDIGRKALSKRYGTEYKLGPIATIIYEAAGSTVDYAYVKHNVSMSFALELRDTGHYGFLLPKEQIIPTCEETFDGLMAAINAL